MSTLIWIYKSHSLKSLKLSKTYLLNIVGMIIFRKRIFKNTPSLFIKIFKNPIDMILDYKYMNELILLYLGLDWHYKMIRTYNLPHIVSALKLDTFDDPWNHVVIQKIKQKSI